MVANCPGSSFDPLSAGIDLPPARFWSSKNIFTRKRCDSLLIFSISAQKINAGLSPWVSALHSNRVMRPSGATCHSISAGQFRWRGFPGVAQPVGICTTAASTISAEKRLKRPDFILSLSSTFRISQPLLKGRVICIVCAEPSIISVYFTKRNIVSQYETMLRL